MLSFSLQRSLEKSAAALSTDFCPGANRWVYWLKNPFWLLTMAIISSGLCGIFLNPWIFTLTALLFAIVGTGTLLPWIAMRGIQCRVIFDVRRVRFGAVALVRLRITNRWPLPVWGLSLINGFSIDTSDQSLAETDEGVAFTRVPGWATIEYSWPFVARQRGTYPRNSFAEVETSFPFGLFRARRKADVEGSLIVWPETVSLAGLPDSAESQFTDDGLSDRQIGDFGDTLGTRPFREGDSLRRVHWAQTARQQSLIVTEHQAPVMTSVTIDLDLSPESHPTETRQETVEQCVRVAASLCDSLHHQHCRVELLFNNKQYVAGSGAAELQKIMDALAVAEVEPQTHISKTRISARKNTLQITVTTSSGRRADHHHQQIVVESKTPTTAINSNAWININDREPIRNLATSWKKAMS